MRAATSANFCRLPLDSLRIGRLASRPSRLGNSSLGVVHSARHAARPCSGLLDIPSTLPPGPALLATFTGSGDIVGGAPTDPGVELGRTFTVQGTGDQGEPLYQASSILVDQNLPLAINASGGTDLVGTVGQPFAQNFFLSGGAGPYTWSMASGQLPRPRRRLPSRHEMAERRM